MIEEIGMFLYFFFDLVAWHSHACIHTPVTSDAVNKRMILINLSVYNESPVILLHAHTTKPSSRLDTSCAKGAALL